MQRHAVRAAWTAVTATTRPATQRATCSAPRISSLAAATTRRFTTTTTAKVSDATNQPKHLVFQPRFTENATELTALTALAAVDGRYGDVTQPLRNYFSEFAVIRARMCIEVEWFKFLANCKEIKELQPFAPKVVQKLDHIMATFSVKDADHVKNIEKVTKHDIKAIEYWLKERFAQEKELNVLIDKCEFLHFGLTSEDISNLATGFLLQSSINEVFLPVLDKLLEKLNQFAKEYAEIPMIGRTHGQLATPTTVGKEFANAVYRLQSQVELLRSVQMNGKLNGAVGNFNALVVAYPDVNWLKVSSEFIEGQLGLTPNLYTTQIESKDKMSEIFHIFMRLNTILLDFDRNIWTYISLGYFKQQSVAGEVGSSTMPHKINPIDFENSEGQIGIANAILDHLSAKLCISRMQRDLSDSSALRSLGTAFGHSFCAYKSTLRGLGRIQVNQLRVKEDIESAWEVLGEPIQTVMRRYDIPEPYEKMKELTRGKKITKDDLHTFIKNLDLPENVKHDLLQLTPEKYIGLASQLARLITVGK